MRKVRAAGKDYYKVLGVPRDCDASALKKAYRKVHKKNLMYDVLTKVEKTNSTYVMN